jgi:hypothetical protein
VRSAGVHRGVHIACRDSDNVPPLLNIALTGRAVAHRDDAAVHAAADRVTSARGKWDQRELRFGQLFADHGT